MQLSDLRPADGATKKKKRVGRGFGSGHGKTATRGYNGQGQRSGESSKPGFEGGQMPLFRRTPKKHHFTRPERYLLEFAVVNVGQLSEHFSGDQPVTADALAELGMVRRSKVEDAEGNEVYILKPRYAGVRVLGHGEVSRKLEVHAHHFTASARTKIEAAGGKCVVIGEAEAEASE